MTVTEEQGLEIRAEIARYGQRMIRESLVKGTAGNISVRSGDDVYITPTSVPYDDITADQIVRVGLDGSGASDARPSSETPLHTLVYRSSGAGAIVHTHSMFATTMACCVDEIPPIHYMIWRFGGDSVRVADYARFGSDGLAEAVRVALADRSGALLRNHGSVVYGDTLAQAYDRAVLLEWLCELYWRSCQHGGERLLSTEQVSEVATEVTRRRYAGG